MAATGKKAKSNKIPIRSFMPSIIFLPHNVVASNILSYSLVYDGKLRRIKAVCGVHPHAAEFRCFKV